MPTPNPNPSAKIDAIATEAYSGVAVLAAPRKESAVENDYRLPQYVRPTLYDLGLSPDLEKNGFAGHLIITLEIAAPTREITMHAVGLAIATYRVHDVRPLANGRHLPRVLAAAPAELDDKKEWVTFRFADELPAGTAKLSIIYCGTIAENMCGLYKSTFTKPDGSTGAMLSTQFEPTHARRMLPCFDEPAFKAVFRVAVSLERAGDLTVLSNQDVCNFSDDEWSPARTYQFADTPAMSTYLLAVVIGELEFVEQQCGETLVRVYCQPGDKERCTFALDVACRGLAWLQDYFGTDYPLSKLDLVVVSNFAWGAMENWGLITFNAKALLCDPMATSADRKQRIAETILHEIAHQWFGNLVTPQWWDQLWLNESFATWMANKALDALYPDWRVWENFVAEFSRSALRADSMAATHPVEMPVSTPEEIESGFDDISYEKGGCLLRMLETHLGEGRFRDGLQAYMAQHPYGNATSAELWATFEAASGEPVGEMMRQWTTVSGYPLITITADHFNHELKVEQRRFALSSRAVPDAAPACWQVPLRARHRGGDLSALIKDAETTLVEASWPANPVELWLHGNADRGGFYRVRYDFDAWWRKIAAVRDGLLTPNERVALIDDAFALSLAGLLPASDFLRLAQECAKETTFSVLLALKECLEETRAMIQEPGLEAHLKSFLKARLIEPLASRIGWEASAGGDHLAGLKNGLLVDLAGQFDLAETVSRSLALFYDAAADTAPVQADIRSSVYLNASRHGGIAAHDLLVAMYRRTTFSEEQLRLLWAMTATPFEAQAKQAWDFIMTDEVRRQDKCRVIGFFGGQPHKALAWGWLCESWPKLVEFYMDHPRLLSVMIEEVTCGLQGEDLATEIKRFFAAQPVPGIETSVAKAIERVRINTDWLANNAGDLRDWLTRQHPLL